MQRLYRSRPLSLPLRPNRGDGRRLGQRIDVLPRLREPGAERIDVPDVVVPEHVRRRVAGDLEHLERLGLERKAREVADIRTRAGLDG